MLSLEIIVVLGFLYCLFIFGTLKAKGAKERAQGERKPKDLPLGQEKMAEEKPASR